MDHIDLGLLIMRLAFGLSLAYHGLNKVIGAGGLAGTSGWFGSLGMKSPMLQARLAATTEILGGLFFACGLLTPFAAMPAATNAIAAQYSQPPLGKKIK